MAVDQDAASSKYLPSSSAQWSEQLTGSGIANPANLYLLQEASGNATDAIGGKTLTASGTLTYQQAVSGWTRKAIVTTRGTAGKLVNNTFANVNASSFTLMLVALVDTTGAGSTVARTIARMGTTFDGDACLESNATPRLQVGRGGTSSRVAGSTNPTGAVHVYFLRVDDTANTVDAFLNATKIVGGAQGCSGTELCFGGDNVQTWYPNDTAYLYAAAWTSALSDADIGVIVTRFSAGPPGTAPTLAPGTTLDAMRGGSFTPIYTVAIEGYSALLTDGDTQRAADAWYSQLAACHFATAQNGLFVDLQHSQQLEPFTPFTMGGQCTLHVAATNETFRRETHRRGLGLQTELVGTINRTATTINVKSTTGWPSSGELYIGTECIGYTGTTSTSFTGCTRGKYSPFPDPLVPGQGFAEHHRDGLNAYQSRIPVIVSSQPRRFIGKWVAVYVHKQEGGLLNDITDALCVYAGRIESITIDAVSKAVVVELKHVLDCIAETTVLSGDQWSGEIKNLIRLDAGQRFWMKDAQTANTRTANDLVVVPSGASGANQINAGYYTVMDIITKLNGWWQSELQAARLFGSYSIGMYEPFDADRSLFIVWIHDTASTSIQVKFFFGAPSDVLRRMGFEANANPSFKTLPTNPPSFISITTPHGSYDGDTVQYYIAQQPFKRLVRYEIGGNQGAKIQNVRGQLFDNYAWLPSSVKPPGLLVGTYGIFLVDDRFLMVAQWFENSSTEVTLTDMRLMPEQFGANGANSIDWFSLPSKSFTPDVTSIKQIGVFEMRVDQALPAFVLSTGTPGYNDPTYDVLPLGIGLGIPRRLGGNQLIASVQSLPESAAPIVIVIDKPTQFADLLAGDLQLRRATFRWKQGEVSLTAWKTPTASQVVAVLDDSNKAAPSENEDHHATATTENGTWAKPIVKIQFNRNVNTGADDAEGYRNVIVIQDAAAIDDSGGSGGVVTIKARNTYGAYQQTGAGIDALAPGYVAQMPVFARPARQATRSITPELFEELSIGDVVEFSDLTAVDPETGELGIVLRHAIVTGIRYSPGGLLPGKDEPGDMAGEVDLFMFDTERWAEYAPCAQVDETATNAGYDVATKVLTCYTHKHSEAAEAVDLSRFTNGDKVRIVEIDPADPAAPLTWDDTLAGTPTSTTARVTTGLGGWDNTKRYRVIFDDYADAVTLQRRKSFQADDVDALVQDLRAPYEYGLGGGVVPVTLASGADMIELPPNLAYGDGRGRDTGHETALIRLVNNLHDYTSSHQMPMLSPAVINAGGGGGFSGHTWLMVMCKPIYLGEVILLNDIARYLNVAPYFRSSDGSSASTRITLAQRPPLGESYFDVDRGPQGTYAEWTFTTTSTSFAHGAVGQLDCRMKNNDGSAWLLVEISEKAETWGVSRCWEGPRIY